MDAKKILHSYLILEYLVLILYNMIDWIFVVVFFHFFNFLKLKSKQYRLGSSQNYNLEKNFVLFCLRGNIRYHFFGLLNFFLFIV